MTECDERQLIARAAQGDWWAFDALVLRHSACVYRIALRMLGSREDAEDVQQEAFVSAYRNLRRFRGDASFGTWIYAITAHLCLSRRRKASRRPEEIGQDLMDFEAPGGDPEERLLATESARRVQQTLAVLSPPDRLLIVLKFIEGMSHDEIAGILNCSVESSRSRLVRAKRLFREHFERME